MRLTPLRAAIVLLLMGRPVAAQPPAPAAPSSPTATADAAQAYYEFMLARRLEADGDEAGALAALDRAGKLDPTSSEVFAERAGFYARQNDGVKARAAAEQALAIDKTNIEAHRILALVFSAWSEGVAPPPPGDTIATLRTRAIEHFEAIRTTPAMVTDLSLQLAYGRVLLRAGKVDEAVTVLEAIGSQAPYIAEPFVLLAEARTGQGRLFEAAEALTQAAAVNPRYFVSLGELYERLGRWSAAAGAYGQAVEGVRAPSRDLRLRYASALLNVPDGEGASRARDTITELLKATPDDPRLLYMLSTAARQLQDLDGAESAARKMLALDPASVPGMNALARTLAARYQFRQIVELVTPFARDAATRAKGREGESAAVLAQLGLAHVQLAEYDAAVAAFDAAERLLPEPGGFSLYKVQTLLAARQFDRALALTGEAIKRNPEDPRLIRLRAQTLARMGRGGEAIGFLEEAIKAESRSPELALALADVYAVERRYDDGLRVVAQAESAFGEADEFTLRRTALLEEAGRLDEAERELRAMIERDPLDATALNYLGYLLADRTSRAAEGEALVDRALRVDPDNPSYLDSLGWARFKQGKAAEALEPLARAAAAMPGNSVIQDHHGDVLARLGRSDEAVAAWQRALAGDNESIDRTRITKKIQDARRRR